MRKHPAQQLARNIKPPHLLIPTILEHGLRISTAENQIIMDTFASTTFTLPLSGRRELVADRPIRIEYPLSAGVRAIQCSGTIDSSGVGSTKDIVIGFRFENARGDEIEDIVDGLAMSKEAGSFIYPLASGKGGNFSRKFWIKEAATRLVVTIRLWRPHTTATYTITEFDLGWFEYDPRFLHAPRFSRDRPSLSWILEQVNGVELAGSKRILDIALDGEYPETTCALIGDGRQVDCVRLFSSSVADSRFAVEGARLLPGTLQSLAREKRYKALVLSNHPFNWATLAAQFATLESVLADDGVAIVAMPIALSAEPGSWRKAFEKKFSTATVTHANVNDVVRFAAARAGCMLPFRTLGVIPAVGPVAQFDNHNWLIFAKSKGLGKVIGIPGVPAAAADGDLVSLAKLVEPHGEMLRKSGATEPLEPLADSFFAVGQNAGKTGDYRAQVACLSLAVLLKPGALHYMLDLIAYLRVVKDFDRGSAMIEIAKKRFPQAPAVLIQQAMLLAVSGRGLEATKIIFEYIDAMPAITVSMRRAFAFIIRNFARECQRAGVETDAVHPLLLPDVMSAYTRDLEGNAAHWHASPIASLLKADAETRAEIRAQVTPELPERPIRILMLTSGSWKFLLNVFDYVDARFAEDFELRTYDFTCMDEENATKEYLHELFAPVSLGGDPKEPWQRAIEHDATLEELVDWCDVVFCEWAGRHAIWLSRYLPPEKRLILRLHSYEAFAPWPFFIDYGGVDGVIFVAEHIRRFSELEFRISEAGVHTAVLPNFNDLSDYQRPKAEGASRNLAMVGYHTLNKDPLIALEILRELRRIDPSWSLHLFGDHWDETNLAEHELAYYRDFIAFVEKHELARAVVYRGYTKDIPSALEDIGFILSCSRREGTHEAVLEGMATGAIPVIRRWPMVKMLGAPETTYPDLTYFDTVEEAVSQILDAAAPDAFAEQSLKAAEYAISRFDQAALYPEFAEFIRYVVRGKEAPERDVS